MTIKEIAQLCGVSRGTVDRVINGRGKVRPETEALILDTLERVGYTKNSIGRALNMRRTAPVIGAVLSSEGNPFFDDVISGILRAEESLADNGVTTPIVTMRGYDPDEQLQKIESLEARLSALVLHPINDPRIAAKVASLAERGVPTVTINSDLENSRRQCYVGSDYEQGGHTAAGVVRLATAGHAQLGILSGVDTVLGHGQRLHGFETHIQQACPGIQIVARDSARDDIEHAYRATLAMLRKNLAIDAIMLIAAGLEGVCRAITELDRHVRVFAFDNIPGTEAMMRRGMVQAIINQQPFEQGFQSITAAFDIILYGKPSAERLIMQNQIQILENLTDCTKN